MTPKTQTLDPLFVAAADRRGALLTRALDAAFAWLERARERRALASLSDHQMKDVGLSRADIQREVDKPFWRR